MKKNRRDSRAPTQHAGDATSRGARLQRGLLPLALLAALCAYWPALQADWFYDDSDYVLNDPRLEQLSNFIPGHAAPAPPPAGDAERPALYLPGYEKPLLADRYLWRLSFALERKVFGLSAAEAHAANLLLHLLVVAALFLALTRLVALYIEEEGDAAEQNPWRLLPGLAALAFAVHPWASEPVCYVSARDGSMGALFVLLGAASFTFAIQRTASIKTRAAGVAASVTLALAAYASKENFIVAPAAYALVAGPYLLKKMWRRSRGGTLAAAAAAAAALLICAWVGIQGSDRARGLFAQSVGGRGWKYLFEIQSPLLLQTVFDQLPALRMSLETNHPGWPAGLCWLALALNAALILGGTVAAIRWPLLLGLGWFYLGVLPTNSFLPRPDFLAMRNFYLPAAGTTTLMAGASLFIWMRLAPTMQISSAISWTPARKALATAGTLCVLFWMAQSFIWARGFVKPERAWARSVARAPDHAALNLNLAVTVLKRQAPKAPDKEDMQRAEELLHAALKAEESPTMAWHTERPRAVRQATALRMLGSIRAARRQMEEAEQYFRRSFALQPLAITWAAWAEACFSQGRRDKIAELVAIGEREWPQAWWSTAYRGLHGSLGVSARNLPEQAMRDLASAESAPDAGLVELRTIQMRALFALAQTPAAQPRFDSLRARLKWLGAAPQDLARLENAVMRPAK